jgi:hypothetical protein
MRKQKLAKTKSHIACRKSGLSICDSPPITCFHIANVKTISQPADSYLRISHYRNKKLDPVSAATLGSTCN